MFRRSRSRSSGVRFVTVSVRPHVTVHMAGAMKADLAGTHRQSQRELMSRRTFGCVLAGLLVAAPRTAIAQAKTAVRRIGILEPGVPDTPEEIRKDAEALRELGWTEGRNLLVERRYANNRSEALQTLAEELVRRNVEVIVTRGTPATRAAKRATATIPIVFRSAGDPVLLGLVESLARPGGNLTGFSVAGPEVAAKYLSLLKELLPALQRIGVVESTNPYFSAVRGQFELTCRSLGLEPIFVDIESGGEIGAAIAAASRGCGDPMTPDSVGSRTRRRRRALGLFRVPGFPARSRGRLVAPRRHDLIRLRPGRSWIAKGLAAGL